MSWNHFLFNIIRDKNSNHGIIFYRCILFGHLKKKKGEYFYSYLAWLIWVPFFDFVKSVARESHFIALYSARKTSKFKLCKVVTAPLWRMLVGWIGIITWNFSSHSCNAYINIIIILFFFFLSFENENSSRDINSNSKFFIINLRVIFSSIEVIN